MTDSPFKDCAKCLARTRRGTLCQNCSMPNGRCRLHGGKSLSGRAHPRYRHGQYTKKAREGRRLLAQLLKEFKATALDGVA